MGQGSRGAGEQGRDHGIERGGIGIFRGMKTSNRVLGLKASATLAVSAKAKELKAQGHDVVSFAAGEPDFDTPEPIKRALIESLNRGETGYGPVPGDPATRKLIAEKLARENGIPDVTPDHVVVSSGGKHSLYLLFMTLLDPVCAPDAPLEVVLPTPAWVSYAPQIRLAGGKVVEVETTAASDFKMTPDQLRGAITARTRAVVINSPSNPCGTMYSPDELRELGMVVARAAATIAPEIVVISDELYEKIIFGGLEHFSMGSMAEIAGRTVTVNGLSKAYAMTGWRVGYAAGSGAFGAQVAAGMRKLQSQSTTSVCTFIMPAIRAALSECDADVERMRVAFAERAEIAFALMREVPGVLCPRPTGAFYLFPDISAHFGKTSKSGIRINAALDFANAMLEEQHVAVVPGEDFGAGAERCFRLTFACAEKEIRRGIERIGAFVGGLR